MKRPFRDPLARARNRQNPGDWFDDEAMTLAEAAAVSFPDGPLTLTAAGAGQLVDPNTPLRLHDAVKLAFSAGGMIVSGLRRKIARGRLAHEMIAGKQFTTLTNIAEMRKFAQDPAQRRDAGGGLPVEHSHGKDQRDRGARFTDIGDDDMTVPENLRTASWHLAAESDLALGRRRCRDRVPRRRRRWGFALRKRSSRCRRISSSAGR
jgi:hypothetical protein